MAANRELKWLENHLLDLLMNCMFSGDDFTLVLSVIKFNVKTVFLTVVCMIKQI